MQARTGCDMHEKVAGMVIVPPEIRWERPVPPGFFGPSPPAVHAVGLDRAVDRARTPRSGVPHADLARRP